jgi:hypothetical protein
MPDGIGDKPLPLVGVKFLQGHHQAHVPLLDHVEELDSIAPVFKRHLDHKPEVGGDNLLGGLHSLLLLIPDRQGELLSTKRSQEGLGDDFSYIQYFQSVLLCFRLNGILKHLGALRTCNG